MVGELFAPGNCQSVGSPILNYRQLEVAVKAVRIILSTLGLAALALGAAAFMAACSQWTDTGEFTLSVHKTVPVTAVQLFRYRGFDYPTSDPLESIQLLSNDNTHGTAVVVVGFGGGTISTSSKISLLLGIQTKRGLQLMTVHHWRVVEIRPGQPTVTYLLKNPHVQLYERRADRSVSNNYYSGTEDDVGYHSMSPEQLLNSKLVQEVDLHLDAKAYRQVFGGVN
jgi:hypothetical protein